MPPRTPIPSYFGTDEPEPRFMRAQFLVPSQVAEPDPGRGYQFKFPDPDPAQPPVKSPQVFGTPQATPAETQSPAYADPNLPEEGDVSQAQLGQISQLGTKAGISPAELNGAMAGGDPSRQRAVLEGLRSAVRTGGEAEALDYLAFRWGLLGNERDTRLNDPADLEAAASQRQNAASAIDPVLGDQTDQQLGVDLGKMSFRPARPR